MMRNKDWQKIYDEFQSKKTKKRNLKKKSIKKKRQKKISFNIKSLLKNLSLDNQNTFK